MFIQFVAWQRLMQLVDQIPPGFAAPFEKDLPRRQSALRSVMNAEYQDARHVANQENGDLLSDDAYLDDEAMQIDDPADLETSDFPRSNKRTYRHSFSVDDATFSPSPSKRLRVNHRRPKREGENMLVDDDYEQDDLAPEGDSEAAGPSPSHSAMRPSAPSPERAPSPPPAPRFCAKITGVGARGDSFEFVMDEAHPLVFGRVSESDVDMRNVRVCLWCRAALVDAANR